MTIKFWFALKNAILALFAVFCQNQALWKVLNQSGFIKKPHLVLLVVANAHSHCWSTLLWLSWLPCQLLSLFFVHANYQLYHSFVCAGIILVWIFLGCKDVCTLCALSTAVLFFLFSIFSAFKTWKSISFNYFRVMNFMLNDSMQVLIKTWYRHRYCEKILGQSSQRVPKSTRYRACIGADMSKSKRIH